ncbi:MAG: hypothetical protein Q9215_007617 [Flavoplaca cf. flavocitrina]
MGLSSGQRSVGKAHRRTQLLLSCSLNLTAPLFDHLLDPISSITQEIYPAYHPFESRRKTCNRPLTRSSTRTRRGWD